MPLQQFGLIGYPLTHSFSAEWFTRFFKEHQINASYTASPLASRDEVRQFLIHRPWQGFNVTIPYKEFIIPFLDEVDSVAKDVGAVNCVVRRKNKLIGYNTDILGFEYSLKQWNLPDQLQALIFGTGGASKSAQYVLKKLKIPFILLSRNEIQNGITYADLNREIISSHQLLIQTTPVGTFPDTDNSIPIPYQYINSNHYVFDMVYNPEKSKFLSICESAGAHIKNGLEMLHNQAIASWHLYQTAEDY